MSEVVVEKKNLGDIVHLFYSPKEATRSPLVIISHGSGNDKYEAADFALNLALKGYCAICFDSHGHGERKKSNPKQDSSHAGVMKAMANVIRQNSDDITVLIEHYKTEIKVNKNKIAALGISLGAMSIFYALSKNKDIRVAVPIIGSPDIVGLVKHSLGASSGEKNLNEDETLAIKYIEKVDPLKYLLAEENRPMLIMNGKKDDWVPATFSKKFYDDVKDRYKATTTEIEFFLSDESHYVSSEMREHAIEWLGNNL